MNEIISPSEATIEFGGLVWQKSDRADDIITDIKNLSFALSIGDYAAGFKEGQDALDKDIREVLP